MTPEEIEAQVERWLERDEANGMGRTVTNPTILAELASIIESGQSKASQSRRAAHKKSTDS